MMHCAARGGHSQSIINQSDNQWREKEEWISSIALITQL
jgi:hypothetical protein